MTLLLTGLSHRTAPVQLREHLALSGAKLQSALYALPVHTAANGGDPALCPQNLPPALREAVILSTCNRLEIYATAREIAGGRAALEGFLSRLYMIPVSVLKPHLYFMHGQDAVRHLLRVSAGLDSMVLGEEQILGQVADALATAEEANTSDSVLSRLFTQAVHTGKRARTETDISRYNTSVSHVAALLSQQAAGDLSMAHVAVVGAGEMAKVALQALKGRGASKLRCLNRTYGNAVELAREFNAEARHWHDLPDTLIWADAIISATGAPHTVIQVDDIERVLPKREQRKLVLVDIAVPRDIDAAVSTLPDVQRYDIDDLQMVLDENMAKREAAIPNVETIIEEEAATFAGWLSSREVAPVITALRHEAALIVNAEVKRALNRMGDLSERECQVVEQLARRVVNKLLHEPTLRLREQAVHGHGYAYAHVVQELFALDIDDDHTPDVARTLRSHTLPVEGVAGD